MNRFIISLLLVAVASTGLAQVAPLSARLMQEYSKMASEDKIPVWIYFKDKGPEAGQQLMASPETFLTTRAVSRREHMRAAENDAAPVITIEDIPLDRTYVNAAASIVEKVRHEVKWFNALSVVATKSEIEQLRTLPFVKELDLVIRLRPRGLEPVSVMDQAPPSPVIGPRVNPVLNYGSSLNQNQQINTVALHNMGINGSGVLLAIFDAGFANLSHPALVTRPIVARYDFSTNSTTLASHSHGENTFSVVGGFSDGNLIGPAYGANFVLARTEVDPTETPTEEDNWARAAIWADSLGVDVISCSLGYTTFDTPYPSYTWQDMNGVNTVITRAANRATKLGIVVVNSAGNDGDPGAGVNSLGAPADGFDVITAGAVGSTGTRVSFSSVGPTADGRIKPDVMAQGSGTWAASGASGYAGVSGTSFSCPLTAGSAALILSANLGAGLTPKQVAEALRQTASRANTPDRLYGWGISNTAKAAHYVWIEHTPLASTSDSAARMVTATIKSRIPLYTDSVRVWYGVNGSFTGSAVLVQQGFTQTYRGTIPFLGKGVNITYYIRAKNDSVAVRYPLGTTYFTYQVNNDNAGPSITHTERGDIAITSWPPRLSATVTDITNPDTVSIEYKRNSTSQTPIVLTSADSVYSDTLRIPRLSLGVSDLIEYRFKAVDPIGNTSYFPVSGYTQFRVRNFTDVQNSFESGDGSFVATNDWEYGVRAGTSPNPNSGTKYWGTKLNGNYLSGPRLSTLTTPTYMVFSDKAMFSFYNWYEAESRFDGGNVKISINGGAFQTINPIGGYPIASIYNGFSNPLAGQPGYAETGGALWTKAVFNLAGTVANGNTIAIRFDFGSDNNTRTYRGWYIDDIISDGFGTAGPLSVNDRQMRPDAFALEQNYPNPFNPVTTINYSLAESAQTSLKVFDVLGREVVTLVNGFVELGHHQAVLDGRSLSSGTYFYNLQSGNNVAVKKLMLMK